MNKIFNFMIAFVVIVYCSALAGRYFKIQEKISESDSIAKDFPTQNEVNLISVEISSDDYFINFTDFINDNFYSNIKYNIHYNFQIKENVNKNVFLKKFLVDMCLTPRSTGGHKFIFTLFDTEMNEIDTYDTITSCQETFQIRLNQQFKDELEVSLEQLVHKLLTNPSSINY